MIVASLLLILVAVTLLVVGLVGGSSLLLIGSIVASLLAAIALVVGARQAAATRTVSGGVDGGPVQPTGPDGPMARGAGIPSQTGPDRTVESDAGWRQPPPGASGDPEVAGDPGTASGLGPMADVDDDLWIDEPAAQHVTPADAALVARLGTDVLVIDGRPRYHLADCPHLVDQDPEPLPVSEAVELGFTPCGHCEPDSVLLAEARSD